MFVAVARVTLKGPAKKSFDWLFQSAYTNADGKSVATQPVTQGINFAAEGVLRLDGPAARPWQTVVSREGGFTVDMPAKPSVDYEAVHVAGQISKSIQRLLRETGWSLRRLAREAQISPETVSNRLQEMQETLGFGTLAGLLQFGDMPHERTMRSMKLFADEVLPGLKARTPVALA